MGCWAQHFGNCNLYNTKIFYAHFVNTDILGYIEFSIFLRSYASMVLSLVEFPECIPPVTSSLYVTMIF